ncbi:hypothetical protein PSE_4218 [Pseudovibrio sp. FO-BEG1]|nr:hypothetical protein PSE_4218 [Pseudovibrio sp. FO-BEG1]
MPTTRQKADAHELYSQFGFIRMDPSKRLMVRFNKKLVSRYS